MFTIPISCHLRRMKNRASAPTRATSGKLAARRLSRGLRHPTGLWPLIGKTHFLTDPELIEEMLITRASSFTPRLYDHPRTVFVDQQG